MENLCRVYRVVSHQVFYELFLIPGSKGQTLEEIVILFDDEDTHVGGSVAMPEKKMDRSTIEHVQKSGDLHLSFPALLPDESKSKTCSNRIV